jgi:heme-degrading monooxygenase HmoA
MKSYYRLIVVFGLILLPAAYFYFQKSSEQKPDDSSAKKSNMQQILIDKFIVPTETKEEFLTRLRLNLDLIKSQPGLVETTAYEKTGGEGEFNFVTVAVWENDEALSKAKQTVSAEYRKQGFDLQEMLKRLNVKIDRAVYKKLED